MIETRQQFKESTAYELYLIDSLFKPTEKDKGGEIDLRQDNKKITIGAFSIKPSEEEINSLKENLTPLVFGAAWKIIDIIFEFALNTGGENPKRKILKIEEKKDHASKGSGNRNIIGCSTDVWNAILKVYANTVEHRHCLVHRTAKVEKKSGTLTGFDRQGSCLQPISREEQVSLIRVAEILARSGAEGSINQRTEEHLKHHLNKLTNISKTQLLPTRGASAPVDIRLTLIKSGQEFILDADEKITYVRTLYKESEYFNLLIDIPSEPDRYLYAHAEDCPKGITKINLSNLPSWLDLR